MTFYVEGFLFDLLRVKARWENRMCFEKEEKHQMGVIEQKKKGNTNTVYFMQILN